VHYTTKEDDKRLVGWGLCEPIRTVYFPLVSAVKMQNLSQRLLKGCLHWQGPASISKHNVNRKTHPRNRGWGTLRVV
jgi:hypothetical protein